MRAPIGEPKLKAGGAVDFQTSVYIVRPSDDELLRWLESGEYANVLCSRQTGKTSLLKRTKARLAERGYATAEVEVAGYLGSPKDAAEWYQGLLQGIADQLGLEVDVRQWWEACRAITPNQRLIQFFRDEIAAKATAPVVIFLDEIDSTLKLPYTDDFFVAIRAMYNDRASEPLYRRITFCLVGVATPNELIKDRRTTSYNIGRTIELQDFDPERDDLSPLFQAVSSDAAAGEAVVRALLRWTGGHPFLTLRLCEEYCARHGASPDEVDRFVLENFADLESLRTDVHFDQMLRFIGERVDDEVTTLKLYRRLRAGQRVPDETTAAHINLKLMGLVKRSRDGLLVVRNRIYERVFTDEWAKKAMPVDWNRRMAVAAVAMLVLGFGLWLEVLRPRPYINNLRNALDDYQVAIDNYNQLRRSPGYAGKADELLAQFWERRALREENQEDRDKALLSRLKVLMAKITDLRRSEVNRLISTDYRNLLVTYRHNARVNAVAFSPDGKTVLTGGEDGRVRFWRTDNGEPIGKALPHNNSVLAVAFSPDGKRILTGSSDRTARFWRADSGEQISKPLQHKGSVLAVAFSPDGDKVITGCEDGTARLWRTDSGEPIGKALRHEGAISAVAFSPDGQALLIGSSYGSSRLRHADNGEPIGQPLRQSGPVTAVAFSPDGKRVLTSERDYLPYSGTVYLRRADSGEPIGQPLRHNANVWAVAFSPDGRMILTGSGDATEQMSKKTGVAQVWDADSGRPLGQPLWHGHAVNAVAFSPDGKRILTGSSDGTARLWDAKSELPVGQTLPHEAPVKAVAFSPNGKRVATISGYFMQSTLRLWDTENGLLSNLRPDFLVYAVKFSPDGERVFAGGYREGIWLRADNGQPLGQPVRYEGSSGVPVVAFSPDGRKLITGYGNPTRLWQVENGELVGQPRHLNLPIDAAAFSPDSKRLLTGGSDGTARLWDSNSGQLIGQPLQHGRTVYTVAFSPDGERVLTGSRDGMVWLWNAKSGQPIGPPLQHADAVNAVAFSQDGTRVFVATQRWMHLWSLTGESVTPKASRLLSGGWIGWCDGGYRFIDANGDRVQVAVSVNGDLLSLETLRFDLPDAPPLPGEPAVLLEEWQIRLGLKFDEQQKIVPRYAVELAQAPSDERLRPPKQTQ